MKIVKRIGLIVLGLVLLVTIISLFLPKNAHVERSIIINTNKETPFELVNNLKQWDLWSPWHKIDTAMIKTYSGPVAGTGASYSWDSKNRNVGQGKLTIIHSIPSDTINTELIFADQGTALGGYAFAKEAEGVKVTWWIDFEMGMNPVAKIVGVFMDKMIGSDFETGLKSLKSISESMPMTPSIEMTEENIPGTKVVSIREEVKDAEISSKMGEFFGELMTFTQTNKLQLAGPVFALYHGQSENEIDLETCIPVADFPAKAEGRIKATQLQPIKAVMYDYYGPYSKLSEAHAKINDWINHNSKKVNGSPREVYITDPVMEKDSTKWLTKIYYPVE
ncbi:MAG: SRPBCC family protein [Bacteroidetes bacterium]|nr:SRPBCC family protein [Bacteroidota bacterium]